ncbi:MAG TPA: hypothetical protein VM198_08055 [Longimicrobiales bacterium]|nr:hypothetical protein [Longimicrobiales bacterium]
MDRWRYIMVVALTTAVLVFAVQNLHAVSVTALVWEVRTSVTLIVLGPFLVGLLAGVALMLVSQRRRASNLEQVEPGGDVA